MILTVDVGNTNIVYGFYKHDKLVDEIRIHTDRLKTSDEYFILLKDILNTRGYSRSDLEGICLSSVVPSVTSKFIEIANNNLDVNFINVMPGVKTGLQIKVDNPKEVGADLISTAVAAKELYGKNTIIVDLGTASKITFINENSAVEGVIIMPGLKVSLESLTGSTALLPSIMLSAPKRALGNNTIECMQSGIVYGHVSMIDGMIERVIEEQELTDFNIVATGGYSSTIIPHCKYKMELVPSLLIDGLNIIYKKNIS